MFTRLRETISARFPVDQLVILSVVAVIVVSLVVLVSGVLLGQHSPNVYNNITMNGGE
jgi:hypothetical protein